MVAHRRFWLSAPGLGWAIHSTIALPLFWMIGMSRVTVLVATAGFLAAALAGLWTLRSRVPMEAACNASWSPRGSVLRCWHWRPMLAILPSPPPRHHPASPIFDHSKIAMIDEMIRSGVPAQNRFFGEAGTPERVSYYYFGTSARLPRPR